MTLTVIGFLGGALVLASFAGVALGRLHPAGAAYHAMNLAGALAMVAAGLPARAWPSVTVNVAWAAISAYGLARAARSGPAVLRFDLRARGVGARVLAAGEER